MRMSVLDHLDELRGRLFKIVLLLGFLMLGTFWGADWMLAMLLKPSPMEGALKALQPAAVFIQSLRLSFWSAFVLGLPVLLYHLWGFVSPGLKKSERQVLCLSFYAGTLLFLVGVVFAYVYVIPKALSFFWHYSRHFGVEPSWTIDYYLNFVLMFLLSFGVAFELPLVVLMLVRFGFVSSRTLSEKRPFVVVGIAVAAAALTPPDVVSQIMLAVPLWILFEGSLLLSKLFSKTEG